MKECDKECNRRILEICMRTAKGKIEEVRKTLGKNSEEYDILSEALFCLWLAEDFLRRFLGED